MNRRFLLGTPVAFLIVGCTPTGRVDIARAKADAQAITEGVSRSWTAIRTLYPTAISPALDAQVQATLSPVPALLEDLEKAADAAQQASDLRGIEAIVTQVLNLSASVLAKVPGVPAEITLGLVAVQVLLPIISATANSLVPKAATSAPPAAFRAKLSVEEARKVLKR